MKQFEKLYALDKKGKIRSFEIEVEVINLTHTIISKTGLLDGNKVHNIKEVTRGKQGRSVKQQAEFEANSRWEEKMDEGYKSFDTLREAFSKRHNVTTGYLEENERTIRNLYDSLGIMWNTSRNWTPLPMLAEKYKRGKYKFPMIAQRKYDGVRCIAINNPVRLCSRGGKYYTGLSHIERELKSIFAMFSNIALDGELYAHGVPLNRISGACRKEQRDIFEDYTWIEYHVYDLAIPEKQAQRELLRDKIKQQFPHLRYIKIIKSEVVFSEKEVKQWHDLFVEDGYEGLILRQYDKPYMFSFRDNALLKYKEFIEEDFEIVGCDYDTNVGISSFCFNLALPDGREFGMRPVGSHEMWNEYLENIDKLIGKKATCKFIAYSEFGIPIQGNVKAVRDYE